MAWQPLNVMRLTLLHDLPSWFGRDGVVVVQVVWISLNGKPKFFLDNEITQLISSDDTIHYHAVCD
jgi:hypothetical protein